jgi:hypothetical protein
MEFPPFNLNYLIELQKLHNQFPNLEIVQLDGVLRTRAIVSTPLPASPQVSDTTPTKETLIKMMPNATINFENRSTTPTSPPLSSTAPTFEPIGKSSFMIPSGQRRGREIESAVAPTSQKQVNQLANVTHKYAGSWAKMVEEANK